MVSASAAAHAGEPASVTNTSVRCVVVHEGLPSCGYQATGPGKMISLHVGDWSVKVLRLGNPVWVEGGSTPDQRDIPSLPGDTVQIKILKQPCPASPQQCVKAGPILAYEETEE